MSHGKMVKRGESRYVENWNPKAKRFVNTCALCGAQGYSPAIDEEGFVCDASGKVTDPQHRFIRESLQEIFKPLPLDDLCRCPVCAKILDNQ